MPGINAPCPPQDSLSIRLASGFKHINAKSWDACTDGNPFLSHAFLHALEASGSARSQTGWLPCHLLLENTQGRLIGCAPMYLKGHSMGEYVFDHAFAQAIERVGGYYYPKAQICVPFTPATGPRLLVAPGQNTAHVEKSLLQGALQAAKRMEASSLHLTFLPRSQWLRLGRHGMLRRSDAQFHWINKEYRDFDDFLSSLSSRKRKDIRKERLKAKQKLRIVHLSGKDVTENIWDRFFEFYMDTGLRKWGEPYLTRSFFSHIGQNMGSKILLIAAKQNDQIIAAALHIIGKDTLFGRYWGCSKDMPFLHFELCYYQAMDYAIAHRLKRVEAGAQGGHKLERGYEPVQTCSAHLFMDPRLHKAAQDYFSQERRQIKQHISFLAERAPFRHEQS